MNVSAKAKRFMYIALGVMSALLIAAFSASGTFAASLSGPTASYTPPTELIPADVNTDNLTAIFSTIMSNPVVLTLVLVSLAVVLFGSVMRIFRRLRSS